MATELSNASNGLAKLSLDDFLQEKIPSPSQDGSATLFQPLSLQWERGRWNSNQGRYTGHDGGSGGRGGGRGRGRVPGPPMRPRRGGVRAGVLLTHDQPPNRPLIRKTPLSQPTESVLTIGSHEAQSVKENVGGGAVEGDLEVDLEAVLTNALPQQEVNFVLNQTTSIEAGQKYHFLPVEDLGQVRRNSILKLLVGLLNAGERGVIYMGVNEDGRVEGVTAEPQMIGQFVEGIMKTVQFYLMPRLHFPQYGVRYTNVVTTSGQLLNNVWVVELHAVPQMQHYYNPVMDMDYYIRYGKETKSLPFNDFCNVVVAETSKTYEPEIQRLEEQVRNLRQALESKGIDTSSVGPHLCDDCWLNDCPAQCYGRVLTAENDD